VATYSDVDLMVVLENGQAHFTRRNGSPYEDGADG